MTNTGPFVISANLGVSPGTAVTGFPPGTVSNGTIHATDALAAQAQLDRTLAYNDAAGRSATAAVTADLGGQTLVAGVYSGPTLGTSSVFVGSVLALTSITANTGASVVGRLLAPQPDLPVTGTGVSIMTAVGLLAVAVGVAMLASARRRTVGHA